MSSRTVEIPSGRERVARALRRHRVLVLLVAADVASKMAAFALLPGDAVVTLPAGLQLSLAVNEWGVMGGVQGIGAVTANAAYTMLLAVGLVLFACVIHRLGASSLGFGARVAIGTAVFFGVAFAAQALSPALSAVSVPARVLIPAMRVAALLVSVAFYGASRRSMPRLAFTLLAAGALANALSYVYPPFEVVDFLVVPIEPLRAVLGARSRFATGTNVVGVVNLADLYVFAVPFVLTLWPLAALRARRRAR